jgi:hypothetical protein
MKYVTVTIAILADGLLCRGGSGSELVSLVRIVPEIRVEKGEAEGACGSLP